MITSSWIKNVFENENMSSKTLVTQRCWWKIVLFEKTTLKNLLNDRLIVIIFKLQYWLPMLHMKWLTIVKLSWNILKNLIIAICQLKTYPDVVDSAPGEGGAAWWFCWFCGGASFVDITGRADDVEPGWPLIFPLALFL